MNSNHVLCGGCQEMKDEKEFYSSQLAGRGTHKRCKNCMKIAHNLHYARYKNDPAREEKRAKRRAATQRRTMQRLYGLSENGYNALAEAQSYSCAICGKPETKSVKGSSHRLAVDHCHETGEVRGLLCFDCNTGIGKLNDSVELLEKALEYLKR